MHCNWHDKFTILYIIIIIDGSHCMTQWSPHITSSCDKLKQEMAQMEQDTVTLCEELPDGTRNCKSSDGQGIGLNNYSYNKIIAACIY